MDVFCITSSNPQFQKLLAESGEKQGVFAMIISKWMTENEVYDRYPTLQELGITVMESIKPGVQEVFDSNPELASIGTQEQYSQYLDTVFPNSKVKDIVYHDTSGNIITEGFKKEFINSGDGLVSGDGFYFYEERKEEEIKESFLESDKKWRLNNPQWYPSAQKFTEDDWNKEYEDYKKRAKRYASDREFKIAALVNLRKPLDKLGDKYKRIAKEIEEKEPKELIGFYKIVGSVLGIDSKKLSEDTSKKYDDLRWDNKTSIKSVSDYLHEKYGYDGVLGALSSIKEVVVFEPEQIHILGSNQDIKGFKDFAGSVEDKASESGLSLSSDEAAAYNSLVNDGTIPIKCK